MAAATKELAQDGKTAVCWMGHGTAAASHAVYEKMQKVLADKGCDNHFVGTVEASPTAGELAQRLEVSERTIYRDIDALSAAGIPVFTQKGQGGGIRLMDQFVLDKALLRPGRFDRQVYVGRPDMKGREEILRVHTRKKPLAEDVDLKEIARETTGFTGADLENLMNESALLAARHGKTDFFTQNTDSIKKTIESTTGTMTLLISGIALISLVVGGIGVMNIMLVSVTERTREIGLRIAVGAKQGNIMQQFLIEAVLICLIGGVLGIGVSYLIGLVFDMFVTDFAMAYSAGPMLLALACSSALGIVFGFVPARNA